MSGPLGSWVDGIEGNSMPADDRGLQYGDGLFETILVRNRVARFLDLHLARLGRGLARLAIPFVDGAALRADVARALERAPSLAILKIIVTRGSGERRGYAPSGAASARRIVSIWPSAPLPPMEQGVDLGVAQLRLPEPSPFAGLKHLNRLENVMAAAEFAATPTFDSLLLSTAGRLVSGVACNVFLVKAGGLLTPAVERAGVAGVMRQVVLREAAGLGIATREAELTLEDVFDADAMFITNARIGVVPVRRVREHVLGMSEIAQRLRNTIEVLDA
ncbi:MAG TPA: aminodeoxychorismate lyase [Steroidobacteraceae bacterium]